MRTAALLAGLALLTGCSGPDPGPAPPGPPMTAPPSTGPSARERPTDVAGPAAPGPSPVTFPLGDAATGLDVPWGLAFLPDGTALVTLRDRAEVLHLRPGAEPVSLGPVPGVAPGGEGGLLGIAVDPDDATAVYLYLTTASDNRVLRMRLTDRLAPDRTVLTGIPRAGNHNGGRLAFGPDGYLYVTTGDAGQPERAQDRDSLAGKILRVDREGRPAPGNPDPGSPVWSLGHRNVQGVAWDEAGVMYASEFGQNTLDELNVIEPGGNYGWPRVEGVGGAPEFRDPLAQWPPSEASPSGVTVTGDAVYLAALRGQSLWRVPLDGGDPQRLLDGEYGRLRAVEVDAAGRLWILTSNTSRGAPRPGDDRVVVLDPAALG